MCPYSTSPLFLWSCIKSMIQSVVHKTIALPYVRRQLMWNSFPLTNNHNALCWQFTIQQLSISLTAQASWVCSFPDLDEIGTDRRGLVNTTDTLTLQGMEKLFSVMTILTKKKKTLWREIVFWILSSKFNMSDWALGHSVSVGLT